MKTDSKIPIYYIEEEKDLDMLVSEAINSSAEGNIMRYFQHLAFNYALSGVNIYNLPVDKKIYYIDDES
ncbi:hypothetical protein M3O96_15415 [Aquiflexum sp. TKW24L]|uniref:hypothetical protein n=1 Tax=Aquiflexum sp. TKW24L TaxID=2942212 RepID=UPI0020BFFCF9|nr:hypothetical protein [Aquiflexum sp. TKW24L]MCL6260491.1 hypothetical protein [Aquiflexum sp. TKW24L]